MFSMYRPALIFFALSISVLLFCKADAAYARDAGQVSKVEQLEKRMSGLWLELPVTVSGNDREQLTEEQHSRFIRQVPDLAQSEKREDAVFNELVPLTAAGARNDLIDSQRRWLLKERTQLAKLIAQKINIPLADAYVLSTEERTRRLSVYTAQLKQGAKPLSVVGNVVEIDGDAGPTWGLRVDQFWLPFTLAAVESSKNPQVEQPLRAAREAGQPVSVTGILNGLSGFDAATLEVRDAAGGDTPSPQPAPSRPEEQKMDGQSTGGNTAPPPPAPSVSSPSQPVVQPMAPPSPPPPPPPPPPKILKPARPAGTNDQL